MSEASISPANSPASIEGEAPPVRLVAVEDLTHSIAYAVHQGDLDIARTLTRTLSEILGLADAQPAGVIDITAARKRRGDEP